jgi:hypothetical protein
MSDHDGLDEVITMRGMRIQGFTSVFGVSRRLSVDDFVDAIARREAPDS